MRIFLIGLAAIGFGVSAQAYQTTPGCNFRYHGGNQNIKNVEGYKVISIAPEFQNIQVYGQTRPQFRSERRPAWDGGPMETVTTEIRPATNSRQQRNLINPGYFIIRDEDERQVGHFDKRMDVQN